MRPTMRQVTLLALLAVACGMEEASTERTAPARGSDIRMVFPPWTPVALSFSPIAINDTGIIAGNQGGAAVRYDRSTQVLASLPQPLARTAGDYAAVDVTNTGAVLGKNAFELFAAAIWQGSGSTPSLIGPPPVGHNFVPNAVSRAGAQVVGSAPDAGVGYRWSGGFTRLRAPPALSGYYTEATDVNDAGYAVGIAYIPTSPTVYVVLWSPGGAATLLDSLVQARGKPRIRNTGDVFWSDIGSAYRWYAGTYSSPAVPSGLESLTGVSEAGRLIGTQAVNGAKRGWTSYEGVVSFLDPPAAQPGDYFEPTGVDTCGDIVGVVHHPSTGTASGLLFSRYFPPCDVQLIAL